MSRFPRDPPDSGVRRRAYCAQAYRDSIPKQYRECQISNKCMHQDLLNFIDLLMRSCAGVGHTYYQLPQARGDRVYRERVYCYELYHQMKCRWGELPYSLGGEVDKAGHPIFRDGPYRHSKPDFLVHTPGDMGGNLAVVEVKASTSSLNAMRADIEKLAWYCGEPACYYGAVLLVYGGRTSLDDAVPELKATIEISGAPRFVLARHRNVGEPAIPIATDKLVR